MKTPLHTYDRRHPAPTGRDASISPEAPSVRDRRRPIVVAVAMILVAALIGGVSVFAWDRTGSRDQAEALATAIEARDEALATAATLSDRVEGLQGRSVQVRARARKLEEDVAATRAELLAMLGPALDYGRYFGALIAVGATQEPPRLLIDIEQWFTDQEAIDAAIEDGVIEPGEIIPNGYYIRNENPRWRTVEIDPTTGVTLKTYPFADPSRPTTITLREFDELFSSYEGRLLRMSPYWITVEDGTVVAIEEQFIP
jgi:hypothetical protein